jgi:hypothetical protein
LKVTLSEIWGKINQKLIDIICGVEYNYRRKHTQRIFMPDSYKILPISPHVIDTVLDLRSCFNALGMRLGALENAHPETKEPQKSRVYFTVSHPNGKSIELEIFNITHISSGMPEDGCEIVSVIPYVPQAIQEALGLGQIPFNHYAASDKPLNCHPAYRIEVSPEAVAATITEYLETGKTVLRYGPAGKNGYTRTEDNYRRIIYRPK